MGVNYRKERCCGQFKNYCLLDSFVHAFDLFNVNAMINSC